MGGESFQSKKAGNVVEEVLDVGKVLYGTLGGKCAQHNASRGGQAMEALGAPTG